MIGEAPEFVKSKYFVVDPDWHLKSGADKETIDAFEKHMNSKVLQRVYKRANPNMANPYYTWEGKIVDKG